MIEILEVTKISLLVYGNVCVLYGASAVFMTSMRKPIFGPMDLFQPNSFCGIFFVMSFASPITIENDWDRDYNKLAFLVLYSLLILSIIMGCSGTFSLFSTSSPEGVSMHVLDLILMPILLVLGMMQEGRSG